MLEIIKFYIHNLVFLDHACTSLRVQINNTVDALNSIILQY